MKKIDKTWTHGGHFKWLKEKKIKQDELRDRRLS